MRQTTVCCKVSSWRSILLFGMSMASMASLTARPLFNPPEEDVAAALEEFTAFPKKGAFQGFHRIRDLTVNFDVESVYPGVVSREKLEEERAKFRKTGQIPDAAWVNYWMSKSDQEIYDMISPENPRALVPNYTGGYPLQQGNIKSLTPIWGKPNHYVSSSDQSVWGPGEKVKNPATGKEVEIVDPGTGWVPPEGFPIRTPFKFEAAYRNYLIRKLVYYPYNGESGFDGPSYREHASPVYAIAYAYAVTGEQKYADRVLLILGRMAENYRFFTSNEDTGWGWGWYPWRGYIDDHNFECGFIVNMALAYDLVWDGIPNSTNTVKFLRSQGNKDTPDTPPALAAYIEKNLFGYTWEFLKRAMMGSGGNMMMRQVQTSLVLANIFQNDNILNYILKGPKNLNDYVIGSFFRDGQFFEDSSFYAGLHVRRLLLDSEDQLKHYRSEKFPNGVDLDPDAAQTLAAVKGWPDRWLVHGRTLGLGDAPVPRYKIFEPTPAPQTSSDAHEVGFSMLRVGPDAESRENVLLYHANSGFGHGHFHQLMMKIFAYGYDLSGDLGYPANFSNPKWPDWTKATLTHSTVVVNEKSQNISTASLGIRADAPWASVASAYSGNVYQGVKTYHRTLALIEVAPGRRLLVDIFRVQGGHVHDFPLHSLSGESGERFEVKSGGDLVSRPGTLAGPDVPYAAKGHNGYSYLIDVREGTASGPISATWGTDPAEKVGYRVMFPGGFDGKVIAARGEAEGNPGQSAWDGYLILRREGAEPLSSTFVAVHEVFKGEPLPVTLESFSLDGFSEKQMPVGLRISLPSGESYTVESIIDGSPSEYDNRGREALRISGGSRTLSVNWPKQGSSPSLTSGRIEKVDYQNRAVWISSEQDLSGSQGRILFIKNPAYTKTTSFTIESAELVGDKTWRVVLTQSPLILRAKVREWNSERNEIVSERISEKLWSADPIIDGKVVEFNSGIPSAHVKRSFITGISIPDAVQKITLVGGKEIGLKHNDTYSVYDFQPGDDWYLCDVESSGANRD